MGIVSTHLIFLFILTIRRMKEVTEGLRKVLGRKLNGGWPANMKRLMGVAHHPMMWLIIQTRAVTLFKWPEALFQPHPVTSHITITRTRKGLLSHFCFPL